MQFRVDMVRRVVLFVTYEVADDLFRRTNSVLFTGEAMRITEFLSGPKSERAVFVPGDSVTKKENRNDVPEPLVLAEESDNSGLCIARFCIT